MEATFHFSEDEIIKAEIRNFINEGLQDVCQNRLLDSDTVFEKLEERYNTSG